MTSTEPSDGPRDSARYAFGPFVVDPARRLILRNGLPVPITTKTFDLLSILLEHRGRALSKEDLFARLWPDTFVQENNLTRQISALRKVLGERPDSHDYIVTVTGQGYRFVADVTQLAREATAETQPIEPASVPASVLPYETPQPRPAAAGERGRSRRLLRTVAWMAATVAAIAGGALLIRWATEPTRAGGVERSLRQVTFEAGLAAEPAWSPDERVLAYAADRGRGRRIHLLTPGDAEPRRLTNDDVDESQPAWSPDGRLVAFRSEREGGGLLVADARGGGSRLVAPGGFWPRWSPDGASILFSGSSLGPQAARIFLVASTGGPAREVPGWSTVDFAPAWADWHPSGRLSIWGRGTNGQWEFVTGDPSGDARITSPLPRDVIDRLGAGDLSLERFVWAPSGRFLYFEGLANGVRNIWRVAVDPTSLAWLGKPERLTTGPGRDGQIRVSPDGSRLTFGVLSSQSRVWTLPLDADLGRVSGDAVPVAANSANELDGGASPAGDRLAVRVDRGSTREIWVRSLADGRSTRLIADRDWVRTTPRWSPTGTELAYFRRRPGRLGGPSNLVLASAVDGRESALALPDGLMVVPTDWGPDGRTILAACREYDDRNFATCTVDVSDRAVPTIRTIDTDPTRSLLGQRYSPNRRWLAFVATDAALGLSTLYVSAAGGGARVAITDGSTYDHKPEWAPNGRLLYFVSNRGGAFNVWARRFDPATGTPVGDPFRVTSFTTPELSITPNTEMIVRPGRLLLAMTETSSGLWMLDGADR